MAAAPQLALPLEVAEPFHYHDPKRAGFVAILHPDIFGKKRQFSYRLDDLPDAVSKQRGKTDVWISQGEFYKPNRQVVNLWRMPVIYADLDVHKMARLRLLPVEAQVEALLMYCEDQSIPQPSLVVFSGQGLQAKWLLAQPVPQQALPRWSAVQRGLNHLLQDFGADHRALDASRVLRLVDTASSRSSDPVRLVYTATTPTCGGERLATGAIGYEFDILADAVLPLTRDELAERRASRAAQLAVQAEERQTRIKAQRSRLVCIEGGKSDQVGRHPGHSPLIPSQLAWDRLGDLRKLAELRGFDQGLPSGQRDLFVFLSACFLADARLAVNLVPEVIELAREFAPTWSNAEVMSCVTSVVARAQASARGESVQFEGRSVDPRYRWKNETLIEWLSINAEEERELKTIIGKEERQRRDTARHFESRRRAGSMPRDAYLGEAEARRRQALDYRAAGWSMRAIATKLGVSVGAVANYCK